MGAQECHWNRIVPSGAAMLAAAKMGKQHWYTAVRYANLLYNVVSTTVTTRLDKSLQHSSAFERFMRVKPCGNHLLPYGCPIRYVLDTSMRDSKFDESAEAGHYVGPSFENPIELYVWNGSRHVSVGGAHVADTTRFHERIVAPAPNLTAWPAPLDTADAVEPPSPPAAAPPRAPKAPLVSRATPLPVGTLLEVRFLSHDGTAWQWWAGAVTASREIGASGLHHHIAWTDPAAQPPGDWLDLASAKHLWRYPSPTPPPAAAPSAAPPPSHVRRSPRLASISCSVEHAEACFELATPVERTVPSALIVFAGGAKDEPLAALLRARGWNVTTIDIMLGGPSHNVLLASVRKDLISQVRSGQHDFVFMAPPCSSFAVAKDPPVRDREHVLGLPGLDPDSARYVAKHNEIVTFAATLALVAHARRVPYAIENPSDRGDIESDAYWAEHSHAASIWLTPTMRLLRDTTSPRVVTFPQCAFGSDAQKFTTIWTTSTPLASAFTGKTCTHVGKHADVAHGYMPDGSYRSAQYAAYPPDMNAAIAHGVAHAPILTAAAVHATIAVTAKIDGLHPIQATAADDVWPSPQRLEAARLFKRDKQRRRRAPIRFEQASTGLRARAAVHAAMAMREERNRDQRDDVTIQLYDDAADIADVPLHVHEAHDMPLPVLAEHCNAVRLVRPLPTVVHPPTNSVLEGVTEVYVVDCHDADGDRHPAVRAAAGPRHALDRKTVVYYTPDGVAHAIEPKGIKEALASLQHDQWRLAVERELDNLHGHGAFHLVPKAEALRAGKRIMRMTWVFELFCH